MRLASGTAKAPPRPNAPALRRRTSARTHTRQKTRAARTPGPGCASKVLEARRPVPLGGPCQERHETRRQSQAVAPAEHARLRACRFRRARRTVAQPTTCCSGASKAAPLASSCAACARLVGAPKQTSAGGPVSPLRKISSMHARRREGEMCIIARHNSRLNRVLGVL